MGPFHSIIQIIDSSNPPGFIPSSPLRLSVCVPEPQSGFSVISMGKPSGKKKNQNNSSKTSANVGGKAKPIPLDQDMEVFISLSHELKEEGNKLFQKRDHEGAMLKYEKALNLLPTANTSSNNNDVAYLRTNMASCYMQMGIGEYPRAINQCDLALQVCPRYTKALLKRSKCYQALNRLDLAIKDVNLVLKSEPNNLVALELAQFLKTARAADACEGKNEVRNDVVLDSHPSTPKVVNTRNRRKNKNKIKASSEKELPKKDDDEKASIAEKEDIVSDDVGIVLGEDKATDDAVAKPASDTSVKLVFGEDIRRAQLPANCSIQQLRDIVSDTFGCGKKEILIKYKDQEGDLVTITSTEELQWAADASNNPLGSVRLYIVEVNPELKADSNVSENGNVETGTIETENGSCSSSYLDDWIVQFAQVFKAHVGFNSDEYLNLHEQAMKLHSHAVEDTVTSEEAQAVLSTAACNFQEMAALALFNWGNVHMSRARKKAGFTYEDDSEESILAQAKDAYEYAKKEYVKAGMRYEEALRIKPNFYEAHLAMGLQQFEQAKLSWSYAVGLQIDLQTWSSNEVLELFNNAEDNMERGAQLWEDSEKQRSRHAKTGADKSSNMRSQINIAWGIILYERSVVEYKLDYPVWKECLEVAVEKFQLAGVPPTDIAVTIQNHCANQTAGEGLGFNVDEIVQAWNEMHKAKRWKTGIPSFRLEPLFRRRIPKLHQELEHL